jgi:ATP-dependent Clp protease ATP-binding subunit ClpA
VGKTELALQLAEQVMRDRGSLIVKNMAEFRGESAVNRFRGADPGYIGFKDTSTLYEKVMMRPYSVIVLDDIEMADSSLGDLITGMLSGQAENANGRLVDFSHTIVIMTTNGTLSGRRSNTSNGPTPPLDLSGDAQAIRSRLLSRGQIWQSPLVAKLDEIVRFEPLSPRTLEEVLRQMIEDRKKTASRPLPDEVDELEARRQILEWGTAGGNTTSAHGLESALQRWLLEYLGKSDSGVVRVAGSPHLEEV